MEVKGTPAFSTVNNKPIRTTALQPDETGPSKSRLISMRILRGDRTCRGLKERTNTLLYFKEPFVTIIPKPRITQARTIPHFFTYSYSRSERKSNHALTSSQCWLLVAWSSSPIPHHPVTHGLPISLTFDCTTMIAALRPCREYICALHPGLRSCKLMAFDNAGHISLRYKKTSSYP